MFNMENRRELPTDVISKMLDAISHRGPDGRQELHLGNISMGFNRLSFIDLAGGMQPIQNEDNTISMICNGEIFNFRKLRKELIEKGHIFRTQTDVEVVIHLYEEHGSDFPKFLNGQFAIALHDSKSDELMLVRDYVGIAPLFYTFVDGRAVFASEIKAILEYPGIKRKLNMKAVDQLMNFPGIVSPVTFFEDIFSMESGHLLKLSPHYPPLHIEYWDMQYSTITDEKSEDYYIEKMREMFKNAISLRLIADVPIGFYISGGLDSSAVACFIGEYMLKSYYSFSAEIGTGDLDESRFQEMVKEKVASTHYSTKVTELEIWENLKEVIYYAESAVKESYDVAAYMLSALVSASPAKAVLTGQGSDEFLYGYVGYAIDQFRAMQRGSMSAEECAYNDRLWGDPYFRFERIHPKIRKIHSKIYSKDVRSEMDKFSALAESPVNLARLHGLSDGQRRSYIDFKLRLQDHLLGEHGDRMLFAHSVEGRHPFLDIELLSFIAEIPDRYKLNGTSEKYILKKAAKGIVPDDILRRKKFPFQAPGMSFMIKKGSGEGYLSDAIIKKYGIFDPLYVRELKSTYSKEDFVLKGAYEIDYLLIIMTVMMLCETYKLSV
jgi:asparagine synthase (glutamine-hydrolysing)